MIASQRKYDLMTKNGRMILLAAVSADNMKLYLRLAYDRFLDKIKVSDPSHYAPEFGEDLDVVRVFEEGDATIKRWTPNEFLYREIEEED